MLISGLWSRDGVDTRCIAWQYSEGVLRLPSPLKVSQRARRSGVLVGGGFLHVYTRRPKPCPQQTMASLVLRAGRAEPTAVVFSALAADQTWPYLFSRVVFNLGSVSARPRKAIIPTCQHRPAFYPTRSAPRSPCFKHNLIAGCVAHA